MIGHDTQEPVAVASGNGNAIRGNLMYLNGTGATASLGIVLAPGAERRVVAADEPLGHQRRRTDQRVGSLGDETTSGTSS